MFCSRRQVGECKLKFVNESLLNEWKTEQDGFLVVKARRPVRLRLMAGGFQ